MWQQLVISGTWNSHQVTSKRTAKQEEQIHVVISPIPPCKLALIMSPNKPRMLMTVPSFNLTILLILQDHLEITSQSGLHFSSK